MAEPLQKVISASRRVEMPGFNPDGLADFLAERCPPEKVHTLVLWTKHPAPLTEHKRLNRLLAAYAQIFVHCTVTGMGGSFLEPGIPFPDRVLGFLPGLIRLAGHAGRIRLRVDPLVRFRFETDGSIYTNADLFRPLAGIAGNLGIRHLIFSRMSPYVKVIRRLQRLGITHLPWTPEELQIQDEAIRNAAETAGVSVTACCDPGWPVSACIDGNRLSQLHPRGKAACRARAGGQRVHCGCTKSWDIGWYTPCPGGCVYCYANPVISGRDRGEDPFQVRERVLHYSG